MPCACGTSHWSFYQVSPTLFSIADGTDYEHTSFLQDESVLGTAFRSRRARNWSSTTTAASAIGTYPHGVLSEAAENLEKPPNQEHPIRRLTICTSTVVQYWHDIPIESFIWASALYPADGTGAPCCRDGCATRWRSDAQHSLSGRGTGHQPQHSRQSLR